MIRLRSRRSQKFSPRRHVEKEVPHLDDGARRCAGFLDIDEPPPRNPEPVSDQIFRWTRHQLHAGNGSDAWKGFSPEPKRSNRKKVSDGFDLAGGMPFHAQEHVVPGHTATVVAYFDESLPAGPDLDRNPVCTRIDAVVDQFPGYGCGSLDDLSRSDLGGDPLWKDPD